MFQGPSCQYLELSGRRATLGSKVPKMVMSVSSLVHYSAEHKATSLAPYTCRAMIYKLDAMPCYTAPLPHCQPAT